MAEGDLVRKLRAQVVALHQHAGPVRATGSVNIGRELRADLERVGKRLGYDGTGVARVVLRQFVEAQDARRGAS